MPTPPPSPLPPAMRQRLREETPTGPSSNGSDAPSLGAAALQMGRHGAAAESANGGSDDEKFSAKSSVPPHCQRKKSSYLVDCADLTGKLPMSVFSQRRKVFAGELEKDAKMTASIRRGYFTKPDEVQGVWRATLRTTIDAIGKRQMGAETEAKPTELIALARGLCDKEDAVIEARNSLQDLKAQVGAVKAKARKAAHNRRKQIQDALAGNGVEKNLAKWMESGKQSDEATTGIPAVVLSTPTMFTMGPNGNPVEKMFHGLFKQNADRIAKKGSNAVAKNAGNPPISSVQVMLNFTAVLEFDDGGLEQFKPFEACAELGKNPFMIAQDHMTMRFDCRAFPTPGVGSWLIGYVSKFFVRCIHIDLIVEAGCPSLTSIIQFLSAADFSETFQSKEGASKLFGFELREANVLHIPVGCVPLLLATPQRDEPADTSVTVLFPAFTPAKATLSEKGYAEIKALFENAIVKMSNTKTWAEMVAPIRAYFE
ncbi:unnamed protein product [Prorocentrum cordatum]|uniref:FACT complex subunit n=1 Tax=Prorocentrum cordatum TaxID=2364126 RepID=A0ABN9SKR0_9DINO|nr:unnamed protein product [Polarella glacialis]